jgi:hypothetical protein
MRLARFVEPLVENPYTYEVLTVFRNNVDIGMDITVKFDSNGDICEYHKNREKYEKMDMSCDLAVAILAYFYPEKYVMPDGWTVRNKILIYEYWRLMTDEYYDLIAKYGKGEYDEKR